MSHPDSVLNAMEYYEAAKRSESQIYFPTWIPKTQCGEKQVKEYMPPDTFYIKCYVSKNS